MRLTKYEPRESSMFPYQLRDDGSETGLNAIHKLGRLEDIEEEFGIDLVILLKAVKNGVWCKRCDGAFVEHCRFWIDYWTNYATGEKGMLVCGMDIKDYGKTWALTKEEITTSVSADKTITTLWKRLLLRAK